MTPPIRLLTGAALLALTPLANAQAVDPAALFAEIDVDASGEITQAEIAAFRTLAFAALDADGDGTLSLAEMPQRGGQMAGRRDADGDGTLTRAEFTAPARVFGRIDRDNSGGLSRAEFDRVAGRLAAR